MLMILLILNLEKDILLNYKNNKDNCFNKKKNLDLNQAKFC